MNVYTYVGNNPLEWVDPSGLCKGESLWGQWSDFVRSSDPMVSLGAFGIGILEAVYDIEAGALSTVVHPIQTVKGVPAGIKAIPAAAKQVYSDLTSSDPYTYGNALGKLTAQIEIAIATAKVGKIGGAQKSVAYRYVSSTEAKIAKSTGLVPNTTELGNLKNVFISPAKYSNASAAQKALVINKPTHLITVDTSNIPWLYTGNVEGGTGIEMITTQRLPVINVKPIK